MTTQPSRALDTFPNPAPQRDYTIRIEIPEFTCLCPKTGQPDFAQMLLEYVPDARCIELKALKLYIWSFRDEGHFHEAVTNRIFEVSGLSCRPCTKIGFDKCPKGHFQCMEHQDVDAIIQALESN